MFFPPVVHLQPSLRLFERFSLRPVGGVANGLTALTFSPPADTLRGGGGRKERVRKNGSHENKQEERVRKGAKSRAQQTTGIDFRLPKSKKSSGRPLESLWKHEFAQAEDSGQVRIYFT